ncbi:regulatory protein NPR5 [Selaginella moellendorffii]|uniref:regulatory protein NPR5 n=1 Tax=Selaginella moellendorffii TaxID=88036 RepID=UPI000D1C5938|nr:regulatory protein NPR5 [Selaginella moellendorffii]|eukprot:XP_002977926.2 regulatory protein NPR5 [Selaginella moellendorffii]
MNLEEPLKQLSSDLLNLLANGQAFSDVTFTVEGRPVYAHKCVLAARSQFFRMIFCSSEASQDIPGRPPIPVGIVGYDVFMLMLQFLYSGQLSLVPPHPTGCKEGACWHVYCRSAVDFALEALHAAQVFSIEQLSILVQRELAGIAEKASIEDVMRILAAARKQDLLHLWSVCSKLVAKSGLSSEVLRKHLPGEVVAEVEAIRQKCGYGFEAHSSDALDDQRTRRMQKALDSSDVELVRLMVMGEGLDLDKTLAIHYAVANCSRKVVKNLLELGAANVNMPGPDGRTPLHIAGELADPEMIAVLLDHHADPHSTTPTGATALNILQNLASEALAVGALTGVTADHNKLRLCLDLLESAAAVPASCSRDEDDSSSSMLTEQQQQRERRLPMMIGQPVSTPSSTQQSDPPTILMHQNYYPVISAKGHSPTWSEQEEVIDPMPRLLPLTQDACADDYGRGEQWSYDLIT